MQSLQSSVKASDGQIDSSTKPTNVLSGLTKATNHKLMEEMRERQMKMGKNF